MNIKLEDWPNSMSMTSQNSCPYTTLNIPFTSHYGFRQAYLLELTLSI